MKAHPGKTVEKQKDAYRTSKISVRRRSEMGLFGSKKDKVMPKVSDIFSAQDLQTIEEVVGPKHAGKSYGKYGSMAATLMEVVKNPDKEYSKREWTGIIYAAGGFTKIEPDLAPMMKEAIGKYKQFK